MRILAGAYDIVLGLRCAEVLQAINSLLALHEAMPEELRDKKTLRY